MFDLNVGEGVRNAMGGNTYNRNSRYITLELSLEKAQERIENERI